MNTKISFRPLSRADFDWFPVWLNAPEVKKWWHEPSTPEAIEEKYGPRVEGKSATSCFVVVADNTPIGMTQSYWVKDYKDYAEAVKLNDSVGMDWFIGNESYLGKGLGPAIAIKFTKDVVLEKYHDVKFIVASPSIHNARSMHVLEKAGSKSDRS
ncbi:GNAT family N-acetyltransferase [Candidatus Saccharibacteria bacterium]|nr:GNAT family N-acetyltransferase [Candidatus Saccharibacteria bacterium]